MATRQAESRAMDQTLGDDFAGIVSGGTGMKVFW